MKNIAAIEINYNISLLGDAGARSPSGKGPKAASFQPWFPGPQTSVHPRRYHNSKGGFTMAVIAGMSPATLVFFWALTLLIVLIATK